MWQTMLNTLYPGSDGSKGYARDATGTIEGQHSLLCGAWSTGSSAPRAVIVRSAGSNR
jgi:hypothetical protein